MKFLLRMLDLFKPTSPSLKEETERRERENAALRRERDISRQAARNESRRFYAALIDTVVDRYDGT